MKKKIQPFDLIKKVLERKQTKGVMVFTNGCFDLLHIGHIRCLKYARGLGDYLVVAINTDESIKRLKGDKRPIIPLEQRVEMLEAIRWVDYVVIFDEDTPDKLITLLTPQIIIKGGEYEYEDIVGFGRVKETVRFPMVEGVSTTAIINKIKEL